MYRGRHGLKTHMLRYLCPTFGFPGNRFWDNFSLRISSVNVSRMGFEPGTCPVLILQPVDLSDLD